MNWTKAARHTGDEFVELHETAYGHTPKFHAIDETEGMPLAACGVGFLSGSANYAFAVPVELRCRHPRCAKAFKHVDDVESTWHHFADEGKPQ